MQVELTYSLLTHLHPVYVKVLRSQQFIHELVLVIGLVEKSTRITCRFLKGNNIDILHRQYSNGCFTIMGRGLIVYHGLFLPFFLKTNRYNTIVVGCTGTFRDND